MLISLRWLNQVFDSGLDVDTLFDTLTMAGLEVEEPRDLGLGKNPIVVAQVQSFEKHPDADKLNIVQANIGEDKPAVIVCGAPNVREGMLVPCALPGAVLPGDFKIKKSKIRGQESSGMLCSAVELGYGTDASGIMDLPDTFTPGEPFDYIVDVKITPNRADCLSIQGIARDLAAMLGKKKTFPSHYRFQEKMGMSVDEYLKVEIQDKAACPRYTGRYIQDIKVEPSPLWMRRTLEACGLRAINNIVDVTNFVMYELGLPMHAFDYDKLRGGKIIVRFAEAGEKLLTITGEELELQEDDLVIADAERPVALAGVMGGKETEVTAETTRIVLECAYFDPSRIRRTARRHGLQTDSSYRFERGVDRAAVPVSSQRATQFIQEMTNGTVARGLAEVHASQAEPQPINLRIAKLNEILNLELDRGEVADILVRLGCEVVHSSQDSLAILAPSYRVDMAIEADLIEEIARIYGYDKIPVSRPGVVGRAGSAPLLSATLDRELRELLTDIGLYETVHYSFTSEAAAEKFGHDPALQPHLTNPLTRDQAIMRPCILPDLIRTTAYNQRQGAERVALFESGKTFKSEARAGELEDEGMALAITMTGPAAQHWSEPTRELDFYDIKGTIDRIGEHLGLGPAGYEKLDGQGPDEVFHPGRSARFGWQRQVVGIVGELHPALADKNDLRGRVLAAEMNLARIFEMASRRRTRFKEIPRLPGSQRDLAVVVGRTLDVGPLLDKAQKLGKPLVDRVRLLDVYTGEHVAEDKKSLTLNFSLRKPGETLTEDQITAAMDKIQKGLEKEFDAQLRS